MFVTQPNMQAHDELSALFSRNLTLDPLPPPLQPQPAPAQQEHNIVYISQHYTHSAHVARQQDIQPPQQPPRPASEPSQLQHSAVESVLKSHGVETSGLSSAQLQLFKTVDDPQRLKLIELWRASPPTNSTDNPTLEWSMTTVGQEEILAKLRYEQRQQAEQQKQQQQHTHLLSLDGTPLTPIQGGDGRWMAAYSHGYMEPYMASGYEEMARREYEESQRRAFAEAMQQPKELDQLGTATGGMTFNPSHADPVYNNSASWAQQQQQQQMMADQYGRMMVSRNNDEEML
ncbi:hypothetical protein B0T22DRAFT_496792 [Podospora appendiculata]|uniref:Uncharacterized protein n=1 Tax=Podospora appendiculata TaxID=314037 RepID=A0AAE0XJ03_9PEZI|nr:hypothetical protein B0T22DRAFT_496792 [Podospora appendiculata]